MSELLSMSDIEAARGKKLKAPKTYKKEDTPTMNNPHTIKDTVYIAIITAFVMFAIGAYMGFTKANDIEASKDQAVSAATASVLKDQTSQK
jgi:hypothetical protein